LDSEIDITQNYVFPEVHTEKSLEGKETWDICRGLPSINLQENKSIKIIENKTLFFDALWRKKFTFSQTLDISRKRVLFSKITLFYTILIILWLSLLLYLDKIVIEARVNSGYNKLTSIAKEIGGIEGTKKLVNDARFDFLVSDILFTPFKFLTGQKIWNGYHAIKWWKMLTKSLDNIFAMYDKVLIFIDTKDIKNIYFTQLLTNLSPEFLNIEDSLRSTLYHYQSIQWIWNKFLEEKLSLQISRLQLVLSQVEVINNNFSTFLDILWHRERKKYLVVFQNSDEIRPTGGFMGSMAVVEVFRWKIQKFSPRDVYSFEWDLKKSNYERVSPPRGIDTLTSSFGLRDANYYINLKDSSETIRFFVEKSGQEIDGIIYINQNILEDLLKSIWWVEFKKINKKITAENFSEIMSLLVEAKIYKEGTQWTPKKVLFDFMDVFKKKLLEEKKYSDYGKVLFDHFRRREIMMYSFNREENGILKELGLDGTIEYRQTLDFSYPVYTSLSGNKSDRYMERSYKKNIKINADCSIQTNLSLISRHSFSSKKRQELLDMMKQYNISSKKTLEIQWSWDNYQFVRVILPQEAIVSPQENISIRDYGKRRGVEFYIRTQPTQTVDFSFKYTLPNKECRAYDYMLYKQPWIREYDVEVTLQGKQERFSWLERDFFYSWK